MLRRRYVCMLLGLHGAGRQRVQQGGGCAVNGKVKQQGGVVVQQSKTVVGMVVNV